MWILFSHAFLSMGFIINYKGKPSVRMGHKEQGIFPLKELPFNQRPILIVHLPVLVES